MTNLPKPFVLAGAIAGLALLPACSDSDNASSGDPTQTLDESTRTVAAVLGVMSDMSSLNGAISASELGSIFDGPGSYTVLAPDDAAFEALGERGTALMEEDQRPVLVGLLREHILPGLLTPENIAQAIADKGGEVSVTTFGGSAVTFTKEGDQLIVTNEDGTRAVFAGSATAASNGAVIPIDAVLVPGE